MKKVLALGMFDILHPGHLYYLEQAKKLGDHLTVLVASDTSAKLRGKKVIFDQKARARLVKNIRWVDKVIMGADQIDERRTVETLAPDIIALGFNQSISEQKLKIKLSKIGWQGRIVRLRQLAGKRYSSTKIKEQINHYERTI